MANTRKFVLWLAMAGCWTCGPEREATRNPADFDATADGAAGDPGSDGSSSDGRGGDEQPGDAGGPGWWVVTSGPTEVWQPQPADGCLVSSGTVLPAGMRIAAISRDQRFVLIDEQGSCVVLADVVEEGGPENLTDEPARAGVVQVDTNRWVYDDNGCPSLDVALTYGTEVEALARSFDGNYRGYVVIDRELGLAPVRHVDSPGWEYPWHASLQLLKEVTGGWVIGGGALVDEYTVVTASHLGVDSSWCYSREPITGIAWDEGLCVCDNIAGPATNHPDGVDISLVQLVDPEAPPFVSVRQTELTPGEAIFAARWSYLVRHSFSDTTVKDITNENAWCDAWPPHSSFTTRDLVVDFGDSGGPAFLGDELVGVVHGEACRVWPWDPVVHVFVHVPGVWDFVQP